MSDQKASLNHHHFDEVHAAVRDPDGSVLELLMTAPMVFPALSKENDMASHRLNRLGRLAFVDHLRQTCPLVLLFTSG